MDVWSSKGLDVRMFGEVWMFDRSFQHVRPAMGRRIAVAIAVVVFIVGGGVV